MAKLLLVESLVFMRQNVKSMVERAGHQVVGESECDYDLVELYRNTRPDVTLFGLSSKEDISLDAVRQLNHKHPEAVVLIYGYKVDQKMVIESVSAGVYWVFVKPLDEKRLLKEIERWTAWASFLRASA